MSDPTVGPAHDLANYVNEVRAVLYEYLGPDLVMPETETKMMAEMVVARARAADSKLVNSERLVGHHRLESNLRGIELDDANKKLTDAMTRVRSILEQHLGLAVVPPNTGMKELAEMLVEKNTALTTLAANVCGVKAEGYPNLGDMLHALVWAIDDSLPPESRMLIKIVGLHEKTISTLKARVAELEELAETRRKKITMWANAWLEELVDRMEVDDDFYAEMKPGLTKVYEKLMAKRKGYGPQ